MNHLDLIAGTARRRALLVAAGLGLALATSALQAQPLSDKPIRIIVGAPAGGSADIVARLVGEAMGKNLGQPVVVDNKPGALGAIATESFFSAPRDGLTYLLSVNGLLTELPHSLKPKYDPLKDLKPLVELAASGLVLVGNAALPPRNLAEMVSYVKANPGKVNFASYTPGTLSHVMGLQLNQAAGLDMLHIGYKGSPPALQDLMGGQVQFMFDGPGTSIPHIRAGKLRAFAISSPERSPMLPDVPTLAELGYRNMTKVLWIGLFGHTDAPVAAQHRIRDEALKALATPGVRERLTALGMVVNTARPPTTDEMWKSIAADYASVGDTLKSVNYKPE